MFLAGPVTPSSFLPFVELAAQDNRECGNHSYKPASSPINNCMQTAAARATTTGATPNRVEMPLQASAILALQTTAPLWPSAFFGLASEWNHRNKPKHPHENTSKRRAMSPIQRSDENNAAEFIKQPLQSCMKKKPSRANLARTTFEDNTRITATLSPHSRNNGVSEPRDTSHAFQPRRMRFYLKLPKNHRKAPQQDSPQVELLHQPKLLQPTPCERSMDTTEVHSTEITTYVGSQSLCNSTELTPALEVHSSGSSTDTASSSDVSVASSGISVYALTSDTSQPGESTEKLPPITNPVQWPSDLNMQPPTRGFMRSISRPVGLLQHYFTRVNDGVWTLHSMTETNTVTSTAIENSSGHRTSSQGLVVSSFPARAACLGICLALSALVSFWACYTIAAATFAGWETSDTTGNPVMVRAPDEEVLSPSRKQRVFYWNVPNSPLVKDVSFSSSQDVAESDATEEIATVATVAK
ncbi:hypothetical protein MRX96_001854 [Rhipicephalus microplus]